MTKYHTTDETDYIFWAFIDKFNYGKVCQEKDIDAIIRSFVDITCVICQEEANNNFESSVEVPGGRMTDTRSCNACGKHMCQSCFEQLAFHSFLKREPTKCPACREIVISYEHMLNSLQPLINFLISAQ